MSEITERLAGPMPPQLFLKLFIKPDDSTTIPPMKRVARTTFSAIKPCSSRRCIEEKLAHAITSKGFCPNFVLENRPEICVGESDAKLRPRLCLFSRSRDTDVANDWQNMEFFVVVNEDESMDPFSSPLAPPKKGSRRSKNVDTSTICKEGLEELEACLVAQLSRQHRRWVIALYVFGQSVRFLRVDRAGIVVADAINYVRDPRTLAEFLWRYNHLSPTQRGFDSTAVPATSAERRLLSIAVLESISQTEKTNSLPFPNMRKTLSKDYPTYKVEVVDQTSEEKSWYIIRRPSFDLDSPFGRTTRGYVALKVDADVPTGSCSPPPAMLARKLVFFKDCWRHDEMGVWSEAGLCQQLADFEIPHTPRLIAGGDVYTEEHAQHTFTQKLFLVKGLTWLHVSRSIPMYVHHRLVQPLAFPLKMVRTAKETVQVLRDVLQALIDAYVQARILHRDISVNNILVSPPLGKDEAGRGILNDWDIARVLEDSESILRLPRQGTWRFMSVALLGDQDKPHSIHDDLESVFWVLIYIAVHHFKHVGWVPLDMFDEEYVLYPRQRNPIVKGGAFKHSFLVRSDVRFNCPALDDLVHILREFWRRYYNMMGRGILATHDRLDKDPSELLDIFDAALSKAPEAWAEGEWVEDIHPRSNKHSSRQDAIVSVSCSYQPELPSPMLSSPLAGARKTRLTRTKVLVRKRQRGDACEQPPVGDEIPKAKRVKHPPPPSPIEQQALRRSSRLHAKRARLV